MLATGRNCLCLSSLSVGKSKKGIYIMKVERNINYKSKKESAL